mgnify:FL=1
MSEISCIKLICGYMNFSWNTFPKIYQKLDSQFEIRLSVVKDVVSRPVLICITSRVTFCCVFMYLFIFIY